LYEKVFTAQTALLEDEKHGEWESCAETKLGIHEIPDNLPMMTPVPQALLNEEEVTEKSNTKIKGKSGTKVRITSPKGAKATPRKPVVLVVDDEPVNRRILVHHLNLANVNVIEASNGPDALAILEREVKIDLIVLDVMMPRMSGLEVCTKIREKWHANVLPVVLLTAANHVSDLVGGFECGANDYLTKPFTKKELLSRIRAHLSLADAFVRLETANTEIARSKVRIESVLQTTREMTLDETIEETCATAASAILAGLSLSGAGMGIQVILSSAEIGEPQKTGADVVGETRTDAEVGEVFDLVFVGAAKPWAVHIPSEQRSEDDNGMSAHFLAAGVRAFLAKRGPIASPRGSFVVPLTYQNTFLGIIAFEGKAMRKVTESETSFVEAVGASLAAAIMNLRLAEADRQHLLELVSVASQISDKLNSPLTTARNVVEMLAAKASSMGSPNIHLTPEEKLSNFVTFLDKRVVQIKAALDTMCAFSSELSALRDSAIIEATSTLKGKIKLKVVENECSEDLEVSQLEKGAA
jgi:DNA-binding response OmpR family regulator